MRNLLLDVEPHRLGIEPTEPGHVSLVTSFRHQLHAEAYAEYRSSFLKHRLVEHIDQSGVPQSSDRISKVSDTRKDDLVRRPNFFNRGNDIGPDRYSIECSLDRIKISRPVIDDDASFCAQNFSILFVSFFV